MDPSAQAREAAAALRSAQAALPAALESGRDQVAGPLAQAVARAAAGPWAPILAAGTRVVDGVVVIGGPAPRVSGGAGPGDVVYGTEYGGGGRVGAVAATGRRRGHRRRTTAQFRRHRHPFIEPTITAQLDQVAEAYTDLVLDVFNQEGLTSG